MKPWCLTGFLLAVLFIFGCQGPGQITKLRIQHVESAVESKGSPLTVASLSLSMINGNHQSTWARESVAEEAKPILT